MLIIFEIFESSWQNAPNFGSVVEKLYELYQANIFLLFLMHPSFYLTLFLYLYYEKLIFFIIVIIKGVDIIVKLWLIKKIEDGSLSPELRSMFSFSISPMMIWMNVFIYPAMFIYAFW